ncbi:MAG: hypothetical protein JRN68_04915 [Nitrososphaerota archaeon]|nr:hypothetical protein [Nitrososphaerota archaeon]
MPGVRWSTNTQSQLGGPEVITEGWRACLQAIRDDDIEGYIRAVHAWYDALPPRWENELKLKWKDEKEIEKIAMQRLEGQKQILIHLTGREQEEHLALARLAVEFEDAREMYRALFRLYDAHGMIVFTRTSAEARIGGLNITEGDSQDA